MANWALRGLKPVFLGLFIRARYAELAVEAAFQNGIRQYAIVGAGLDSFALRRTDLVPPLRVFEIDRPTDAGRETGTPPERRDSPCPRGSSSSRPIWNGFR